MPQTEAGVFPLNAAQFNKAYQPGTYFICQSCKMLSGGIVVKTVSEARQFNDAAIVEINRKPYFTEINALKPTK